MSDVCQITMGQAPKGDTYNDDGEGVPLLAGAGDFGEVYPKPKKYTSARGVRVSQPGDVIVGIRASIGDKVLSDGRYCLGRGVAGLRAGPELDQRYLWNWVTYAAPTLAAKGRGATFLQVNKRDIAEMEIPLPPMAEQRRIAAILDAADSLRAKRGQAIAKLDTLTQAIFVDMFADGVHAPVNPRPLDIRHPKGWTWVPILSVAEMATGHTPDRKVAEYWDGTISWVNLNEIRGFDGYRCDQTEAKVTPEGVANSSAVVLPAGTVCFSRTASIGFVTVMAVPMTTSQDFVNWICGEDLNPSFLMHALRMSRATLRASSSGSTHKTIYVRDAARFSTLLPPRYLQDQFVRRVFEIRDVEASMKSEASRLDRLFSSLQQAAFRGEL